MGKIIWIIIVLTISSKIFAQYPDVNNTNDSIYIELRGSGSGELNISFYKRKLILNAVKVNEENSLRMRQGDTSITYNDLFEEVNTTLKNDSLYDDFRNKVYYWLINDNVKEVVSSKSFTELNTVWMCLEIWQVNYSNKKKLIIKRCYYSIIGDSKYNWKFDFYKFYWNLNTLIDSFD